MAPGPLQDLSVIVETNEEFSLYRGDINLLHLDGVGIPPLERRQVRSPMMHGAQDKGFRLLPRPMTLSLALRAETLPQADALRERLSYIFAPTNEPLTLKATRDDFQVRYIDCFVRDEIDYPQSQRIGTGQTIVVPLIAPDPLWYDPTQQTVTHALVAGVNANFECESDGMTWDDWPIIDITGPLDAGLDIVMTPLFLHIEFDDPIPAGETIRIDLRPGFKTVRRTSDDANRFYYLNPNSLTSFSTFRIKSLKNLLVADSGWADTFTLITFTSVLGTTGASTATVRWYKRYISL